MYIGGTCQYVDVCICRESEIVLEAEAPAFDKSIRQYMVRVKKNQFDDMVSRLQAQQREINELSSR